MLRHGMKGARRRFTVAVAAIVLGGVVAAVLVLTNSSGTGSPTGGSAGAGGSGSATRLPKVESSGLQSEIDRHYPRGTASEQTSPSVSPAVGSTTTHFVLRLTSRQDLGRHGDLRLDYRILVSGPHPRCALFTLLTQAARGARATVELAPPLGLGWCHGGFAGSVLLEANPNCVPSPPGGPARPCRLFAPRLTEVGRFHFKTR